MKKQLRETVILKYSIDDDVVMILLVTSLIDKRR